MTDTETKELDLLKVKAQEKKIVIGTKQVLQGLRTKSLSRVIVAQNCPARVKQDIIRYATLVQIPVTSARQSNEELGIVCKKNFFISAVGIVGE